jgi:penicillin-binding protein 1A
MLDNKRLSRSQYEAASEAPLGVTKTRIDTKAAPYFMEMVRQYVEQRYGSNQLYEGGLKIYTTLDIDLQMAAEEALEKRLTALEARNQYKRTRAALAAAAAKLKKPEDPRTKGKTDYLQGAIVSLDPTNGQIRALVGGRDFNESNFNRAVQASRQPGSAFKPFIYAAAIDNGFSPTDVILDTPVSFKAGNGMDWSPQNYDHKFRGPVTLRSALAHSVNVPAAKLLQKLGTGVVTSYARRMGVRSRLGNDLSLALGTSEVNLLELTSAYGVFANQGIRVPPSYVLKIEDKNGKVLEQTRLTAEEVLSPETALTMTSMLSSVIENGTAAAAHALGPQRAGGGQDRNDRRLFRRLVRRLHAEPRHGRLGGLRPEAEDRPRHDRRRGRAPDLGGRDRRGDEGEGAAGIPGAERRRERAHLHADGAPRQSVVPGDRVRALPRGAAADELLRRSHGADADARELRSAEDRQRGSARGAPQALAVCPAA